MTIKQKQEFLKNRGYYTGNIDGVWGKLSKEATKKFQKSQHILADGIFGKNTENKANILIKNNWQIGVVKFTYHRNNGTTEIVYVNENILITKNFRLYEFMMNANTIKKYKLSTDRNIVEMYEKVIVACQMIRDNFNTSTTINSAYREKKYNAAVGGSKKSQHLYGKACDVAIKGVHPARVQEYVRNNWKVLGITGMESKTKPNCNQYTHIDIRDSKTLVEF